MTEHGGVAAQNINVVDLPMQKPKDLANTYCRPPMTTSQPRAHTPEVRWPARGFLQFLTPPQKSTPHNNAPV
jgi:hypothetical protein